MSLEKTTEPVRRETVSLAQAMALVGVSRRTLYNWMDANKVEFVYTAGGSRRIYTDTLWRTPCDAQAQTRGKLGGDKSTLSRAT